MGTHWSGIKTKFSEIDYLRNRIKERDFDYIEVMEHPASQEVDFTIKSTQLVKYSSPIEFGIKYLTENEKIFYGTFFFHTFWTTFDYEDEFYIDSKKYTSSFANDDLGWLKLDPHAYWKAFCCKTLERIVNDYREVNFNLIKEAYNLERLESKKEFDEYPDFNYPEYQKDSKETFENFVKLTKNVVEVYKNCVLEKKDLIIDYV